MNFVGNANTEGTRDFNGSPPLFKTIFFRFCGNVNFRLALKISGDNLIR